MDNTIKPSITRIDLDLYETSDEYKNYNIEDIYDSFFHYIEVIVMSKGEKIHKHIDENYHCYIYNYGNEVSWKEMISDIIQEKVDNGFYYTKYPSFILVIKAKKDIYCVTGGLANHLIFDFKDKMFGVNLICKIVEPNDQIIRYVSDRRVYGRVNSSRISNRSASNFLSERNYESIFNEFGTIIERQVQDKLGIRPQLDKDGRQLDKDISVNFGATIHIGKSVTFTELKEIINKIAGLMDDSVQFKFVINFLVPVNLLGIKQSNVFAEFYDYIINDPSKVNIGYSYDINKLIDLKRIRNSNKSPVKKEFIEKYSVNSLNDISDLKKFIINYLKEKESAGVIKNYYFVFDPNEYEKSKVKIKELLDQEYLYKNSDQIYLIEGIWYKFLEDYTSFLNDEYDNLYNVSLKNCTKLFGPEKMNLDVKSFEIESELKDEILKRHNLIDGDRKLINLIEIADAIYMEENSIYLLHNKTNFDGPGIRDITGQINTSMKHITSIRNRDPELSKEFNKYINKLKGKNPKKHSLIDDFNRLIKNSSTTITYIASFTNPVSKEVKSNYIKYLLYITKTQLNSQNFEFYFN